VTSPIESSAFEAAMKMTSREIGSILVTRNDRLTGIVTERDILTRVIALDKDPKKTKLGIQCLKRAPVIIVEANADLVEASD